MPLLLPTFVHPRTKAPHPNAYLEVDPPVFRHEARVAEVTFRIWGTLAAKQAGGIPVFERTIEATNAQYTALVNLLTGAVEQRIKTQLYPDAVSV